MPAKLTVGLTGGVASGKSLVQSAFERLGAPVLDADQVARDVVALGSPALEQIATQFGREMLQGDGTLDRRRMREMIFGDVQARRRLEAITHPAIRSAMQTWLSAQTAPYCMLSVAILVEAGMQDLVDRVLVVDAPEALQQERLQSRDGITEALARAMLAAQAMRTQRLQIADDLIDNSDTPERTLAAVEQLHAFYLDLAQRGTPRAPGLRLPLPAI